MLGIHQKPVLVDKLMIPPVNHDLKLMSIGFFVDDNAPLMWRGPMLHRALEQFLQDVHWGELDVLVVDMPPGTGDVSISLGQMLPRAEAVVVTTPQALAQEVASRAAEMARKTGMQLLGVIENMTSEVFGSGGGERLAAELGVPSPRLGAARCAAARVGRQRHAARALGSRLGAGAGDRRDRRARSTRRAAPASRARCRLSPDEARRRLAALGFRPEDVEVLAEHFLDAERHGREGHGVRRIEWLETWPELAPEARPRRIVQEPGYERWDGNGALGYLVLHAIVEAQLADPPRRARLVVCREHLPDGRCSATGRDGSPTEVSSRR